MERLPVQHADLEERGAVKRFIHIPCRGGHWRAKFVGVRTKTLSASGHVHRGHEGQRLHGG